MWTSNRAGSLGLLRLAGFLTLASVIAATGPTPSAVLTITPATHNYGQVIAGALGANFQFKVTLPPGGSPTDSVLIGFTGANASDFRVNQYGFGTLGANPTSSTCTDASGTWRSGSCDVWVEFIPQATGVRNATLVISDTRGNRGTASLTGTGLFGCVPQRGVCNYAFNYSGTFSWSSAVITRSGGFSAQAFVDVHVSVTKGVAFCSGSQSDSSEMRTGGRLDGMEKKRGTISGPGLFVVEFKKQSGQLVSQVTAWCPTASGTSVSTTYQPFQTATGSYTGSPARDGGSGGMTLRAPVSAIGIDLSSSQSMQHPETDPLNGVSGTLTVSWSLKIS